MIKENQTMPKVVTLKGILRFMLSKWIWVLILVVLCGAAFGGKGVLDQRKKVAKQAGQTEKEVSLAVDEQGFLVVKAAAENEDIVAEKQKYLDESLLMQIDPAHKWNGNLRYRFTFDAEEAEKKEAASKAAAQEEEGEAEEQGTDYEALRQKLAAAYNSKFRSQETTDKIKELAGIEADVSYMNEIMGFEVTSVPGTFYVWGVAADKESMDKLLSAIESVVGEWKGLGEEIGGSYSVTVDKIESFEVVDTALADSQAAKKNDLVNQQASLASRIGALEEDQAAYLAAYREERAKEDYTDGAPIKVMQPVSEVSRNYKKILIREGSKGAGVGLAASLLLAFLIYLLSPVILTGDSITDMYQLPVFAAVGKKQDKEQACEFMKELIAGRKRDKKAALLSGKTELMESETPALLIGKLKEAGCEPVVVSDIRFKIEAIAALSEAEDVYLIEKVGKTRHKDVESELLFASELGLRIAGVFLI